MSPCLSNILAVRLHRGMSVNMQDIDNSINTRIVCFFYGHISYQIDRWFCLTDYFSILNEHFSCQLTLSSFLNVYLMHIFNVHQTGKVFVFSFPVCEAPCSWTPYIVSLSQTFSLDLNLCIFHELLADCLVPACLYRSAVRLFMFSYVISFP